MRRGWQYGGYSGVAVAAATAATTTTGAAAREGAPAPRHPGPQPCCWRWRPETPPPLHNPAPSQPPQPPTPPSSPPHRRLVDGVLWRRHALPNGEALRAADRGGEHTGGVKHETNVVSHLSSARRRRQREPDQPAGGERGGGEGDGWGE